MLWKVLEQQQQLEEVRMVAGTINSLQERGNNSAPRGL